jgi:hypothetical protein
MGPFDYPMTKKLLILWDSRSHNRSYIFLHYFTWHNMDIHDFTHILYYRLTLRRMQVSLIHLHLKINFIMLFKLYMNVSFKSYVCTTSECT